MRSKNQEVDPLFAPFITKVFSAQRIFRVLRNSLFRTNDLKATFGQRQSCRPIFNFYAILIPVSNQKIEIPPIVNQSFMVYIHRISLQEEKIMPFEIGTFSVTLFALPQDLPENYIDLLNANRAGCIDLVKDEPEIGWASGRCLLDSKIEQSTVLWNNLIYISLRKYHLLCSRHGASRLNWSGCAATDVATCRRSRRSKSRRR